MPIVICPECEHRQLEQLTRGVRIAAIACNRCRHVGLKRPRTGARRQRAECARCERNVYRYTTLELPVTMRVDRLAPRIELPAGAVLCGACQYAMTSWDTPATSDGLRIHLDPDGHFRRADGEIVCAIARTTRGLPHS